MFQAKGSPMCEFTAASSLGSCRLHTGHRTLPALSGEGGREVVAAGGRAGAAAAAAAAAAAPDARGAGSAGSWAPLALSGLPAAGWGALEPLGAALGARRLVGSLPSSECSDPRPLRPDMVCSRGSRAQQLPLKGASGCFGPFCGPQALAASGAIELDHRAPTGDMNPTVERAAAHLTAAARQRTSKCLCSSWSSPVVTAHFAAQATPSPPPYCPYSPPPVLPLSLQPPSQAAPAAAPPAKACRADQGSEQMRGCWVVLSAVRVQSGAVAHRSF